MRQKITFDYLESDIFLTYRANYAGVANSIRFTINVEVADVLKKRTRNILFALMGSKHSVVMGQANARRVGVSEHYES